MEKEQLQILESLDQFPRGEDGFQSSDNELIIGRNDPKDGGNDHWWCSYGDISLSGYYSLPKLLADLADGCLKHGYAHKPENALLNNPKKQ